VLIGVVADTHGYLDPRLPAVLEGVEAILHAGDVGATSVLDGLRQIAPVYAVRGNNDAPLGGLGLPARLDVELGGCRLHLVHELQEARPGPGASAVIFGHSHRPLLEWRQGVLFLNPGAAGRRGFHSLQSAALMQIEDAALLLPRIIELGPRLPLTKPRRLGLARGRGAS
jgi:putative phosphoesterase